jgi:hypothetical protein
MDDLIFLNGLVHVTDGTRSSVDGWGAVPQAIDSIYM